MTTKSDFPDEEWSRIVRAPFVAGMAITLADPGGPIEASKETMATLKSATSPPSREELLADVALDIQALTQARTNPLKGYKLTKGEAPGEQVVEELRDPAGDRRRSSHAGGDSRVRDVARGDGPGCGRFRQGRRFHGLPRRAGQRGRAGHAGSGSSRRHHLSRRKELLLG